MTKYLEDIILEHAHSLIRKGIITKDNYLEKEEIIEKKVWPNIPERNCIERENRFELLCIVIGNVMESIFYDRPLERCYELPDDDPTPISDLTYVEIQQKLKEQEKNRRKIYNLIESYWAWDTAAINNLIADLQLRDSFKYSFDLLTRSKFNFGRSYFKSLDSELKNDADKYMDDLTDLINLLKPFVGE